VGPVSGYDAVVVGGGHNGLTCGAYLGRAGLRTLILERRERVGGAAATEELVPGVRVSALAHTVGRLRQSVIRDLGLSHHGLELVQPAIRVFAPQPDGRAVTLWGDAGRTREDLRTWSAADGDAWPGFNRKVRVLASFMSHLHASTPPGLDRVSSIDIRDVIRLGRMFRRLRPRVRREFLRVLPMAVADLVGEAFETDAVRAVVAARGVQFTSMGPWSAGTAAVLLSDSVGPVPGAAGQSVWARGGPGAVSDALASAARGFGAEVRTEAAVAGITTSGERVAGVVLDSGEEIQAGVVVSGLDPKHTMLDLMDPAVAGPTLRWRAGNIRMAGSVAKVNLVLDGPPEFPAANGDGSRLEGRIVIATGIDDLERAFDASKYGRVSETPYLEAVTPTLADRSLAPAGTHVMSIIGQWAPYTLREGDWEAERDGLGDLVLKTLETVSPGLSDRVVARQVLTPVDLERDYGMTGGHPLHGEPGLDQFFAWRPLLGLAQYRVPSVRGLYLCSSGSHPGGGISAAPGANAAREILHDVKSDRR
jgi:phytoene dehydrogenase-like protein